MLKKKFKKSYFQNTRTTDAGILIPNGLGNKLIMYKSNQAVTAFAYLNILKKLLKVKVALKF